MVCAATIGLSLLTFHIPISSSTVVFFCSLLCSVINFIYTSSIIAGFCLDFCVVQVTFLEISFFLVTSGDGGMSVS